MFSPQPVVEDGYPHAARRCGTVRAIGGAGSSCVMYWYSAICRAFQTAAFVRVGVTFSATRPMPVRWLLIRSTTCAARSDLVVPQFAPGEQSPTAAAAEAGVSTAATDTSVATATTAPTARRESLRQKNTEQPLPCCGPREEGNRG